MSSTFTPEDLKTLEETQRMRERLAGVIMGKPDNELPRKPAELMAVTNLLESIDRYVKSDKFAPQITVDESYIESFLKK